MVAITGLRCVEYIGELDHPGPFWHQRLRRPTDVYDEFARRGPVDLERTNAGNACTVRQVFLHIDTDSGLTGTVAVLSEPQARLVLSLRDRLLGMDALAGEAIWDRLHRSEIHGRTGLGMMALSAVDCALWDIRGQHFDVPVHVLLGGPTVAQVPVYVSTLGESLEQGGVAALTAELVADGVGGIKWFPRVGPPDERRGVRAVAELVRTVREAGGDDVEIALDAWSSWDVNFTVDVVAATADLGLSWIEEPLPADDLAGYRRLRERVAGRTAIAGGEHEYGRWRYQALLEAQVLDVHQPDPHWVGGISEAVRIMGMVSAVGATMICHGQSLQCNAAVSFAASPAVVPRLEYLRKLAPLYQHFLAHPINRSGGAVFAPSEPGLGMALDPERILDQRSLP